MSPCDCFFILPIVIGLISIFFINEWIKNRKLPPGPYGLPFVGYFPFLGNNFHEHLHMLSKKYGEILSFRTLGGTLVIILSSVKVVKHVLIKRADEFIGRPLEDNVHNWIDNGLGIAQSEGQIWKDQRRFFLHTAKDYGFGTVQIQETIHEMLECAVEDIKKTKGQPFKIEMHISHITCNVIAEILFKKKYGKDDDDFRELMQNLKHLVPVFIDNHFTFGRYLKYAIKLNRDCSKVDSTLFKLKSSVEKIIEEHEKNFDPQNLNDVVDAYLYHMKNLKDTNQLEGSSFTRERLIAIAMNMFLEGIESVSSALCGLLLKLSHYRDAQRKVQQEIDNLIGRDTLPTWNDKSKFPYLNAVIQELFRLNQPFNLSTFYCNFLETEIYGYRIPKRSIIVVNLHALNNDLEIFSEPRQFNPDRFLDTAKEKIDQDGPFQFGIGKRSCIGVPLNQIEVFLVMATLLQNFTFYSAEDGQVRAVYRN